MSEKYDIGTVLWEMVGCRRNGEIKWYAEPHCIEYVDEHEYLYGNNCGGSWNNIGKNSFLTREECINHFLESHDSLVQEIGIDEKTPDNVYELPRTDWQDYEVIRFDGVNYTNVYLNGFAHLRDVTGQLEWHSEFIKEIGMEVERLKLSEIYRHFEKDGHHPMITVFVDSPMECEIFQCGNYKRGNWVRLGKVMGYA